MDVEFGRNISAEDVDFNRTVTVIGATVAKALFPDEDPIGKVITQRGTQYSIVGVMEE